MRKAISALVTSVALAFAGQQAQACYGEHVATSGSGAGDAACIFNVNVYADNDYSAMETGQQWADSLAGQVAATGAAAGTNVEIGSIQQETDVTFSIPAGVTEVTITVQDTAANGTGTQEVYGAGTGALQGTNDGYYYNSDGSVGSATLVLQNGTFQVAQGPPPACVPPPPPQPPLNAAVPGPGIDPDDNKAAVNDLQGANMLQGNNGGQGPAGHFATVE